MPVSHPNWVVIELTEVKLRPKILGLARTLILVGMILNFSYYGKRSRRQKYIFRDNKLLLKVTFK